MKTIIGLILASVVLLSACDNDEVKELLPSMTASVDGSKWESLTRVSFEKSGRFTVTGTSFSGKTISFTTSGNTEGTYELKLDSLTTKCTALYKETIEATTEGTYLAISGSVTISEINMDKSTISGSFEFSFPKPKSKNETIKVTNGKFSRLKFNIKAE